ncbi:MAG: non-ribosomal peptide synthase/polyketide synthase [Thermoanaerobaculia bacterium]
MIELLGHSTRESATLVHLLRGRAGERPEHVLYTFLAEGEAEAGALTLGELDLRARALGALLAGAGLRGERAVLLFPPGLDFIVGFFGCLYGGVVAVPAYPPRTRRDDPRLAEIVRDCRPRAVLTTAAVRARLTGREEAAGLADARWIAADEVPPGLADGWRDPGLDAGSLAFLQYTSGSTSSPKGVMVTQGNLLHNERMIQRVFRQGPESVVVSWLPLYHDMGLIGGVLQPLYTGARCVLMSPAAFLQSPARWLRAISRYRATTSGGPDFAYELCVRKVRPEQREGLDLSSWAVAFNGAEPVRAATLDRFAAAFTPHGFRRAAFVPCYGLAESTLLVTGGRPGAEPTLLEVDGGRPLVGCGAPPLDVEVTIADLETGALCPPGREGEIRVAGPSVAAGYWERPEETAEVFGGASLRTGDLGFLHGGELFVTGRIKDLVILRGRNHYPQDLELTAERAHPALRPGGGAAFAVDAGDEERLVIVHELERRAAADPTVDPAMVAMAVRRALAEEHEVRVHEVALIAAGALPRTSSGKVRRRATRDAWRAGTLDRLFASGEAPLERRAAEEGTPLESVLRRALAEVVGEEGWAIGRDRPLTELGLDSLQCVEAANRIEAVTGVPVPPADLLRGPSLAELAGEVSARSPETLALESGRAEDGVEPASFGQRALWFLDRLEPGSAAYVLAGAVALEGRLDPAALERALGEVVRRHEALRTTFVEIGGEPAQRIGPPSAPALPIVDLAGIPVELRGLEEERLARAEGRQGFDLEAGPLVRAALLRLGAGEHRLLLSLHHIVADGWSAGVLARELGALYAGFLEGRLEGRPSPLPDLPARYGDFARWQRARQAAGAWEALLAGSKARLAGLEPLDLPTDRPRTAAAERPGARWTLRFPAPGLRGTAREQGATPFMVLLAAFEALLARTSHQRLFGVGSPVANRPRAELEGVVGFFVNTVVLRADVEGSPTFADLVERVRGEALDAYARQEVPFEKLVEAIDPERDRRGGTALVRVLFALQREPLRLRLPGLEAAVEELETGAARFDLALSCVEEGGEIVATFEYDAGLFDRSTVQGLGGRFALLARAGAGEGAFEIDLLSEAERRQIAAWGMGGETATLEVATVVDLFERQARATPDAEALVCGGRSLTYGELREGMERVARGLAALGVGPGSVVALEAERTPGLVTGLLGILAAGAAFLPLDPALPEERRRFLLADSGAAVVLNGVDLPGGDAAPTRPGARDLAYLLYTSGTTGVPKAVAVEHRSLLHTLGSTIAAFAFGPGERMPAIAPFSFDIFLFELLSPLLSGGAAVVLPLRPTLDFDFLLAEIERADRFHAVPAVLRQVVDRVLAELAEDDAGRFASLREVFVGGDAVPPELLADARRAFPAARSRVLYGPTEGTILATHYPVPETGPLPPVHLLGSPLPGVTVRLLDPQGLPVPPGVAGEVHLGGPGVTRGYHGQPGLTASRYLPAPAGERDYRTGDLARWRPDGALEFLGRADDQVKVRGVRVEPAEVEARLAAHPGVRRAAVVARDGGLAAFFVAEGEAAPDRAALRAFLLASLPEAMVPSIFASVPELPLTPHGKLDRKALAAYPLAVGERAEREAPADPLEEIVAGVWADLLGIDRVGRHDGFFDLGGHSLLATRAASRLREVLGVEVPLRTMFEEPTVAGIARALRTARQAQAPPLRRRARSSGEPLPLSFAQQRLWFLWRLAPGSAVYNMPAAIRLAGPLDAPALERCFGEIVRRHEALRTRFPAVEDRPAQVVDPPRPLLLPCVDLGKLPGEARRIEAERLTGEEARRPYDLARGPLLRATLLRLENGEHLLLVTLHHVIADGWSVGVLHRELAALYPAFAAGRPSPLPEPPVQYGDFTLWQREWLRGEILETELAYWRRRLADLPPLELPADRPRPAARTFRGATQRSLLPADLGAELRALARSSGATLFMTLLAGFEALVHRYTGSEDVALGTPVANRERTEIEGLVGFFVNTLVLRVDLSGYPSMREVTARVREAALEAWTHQALPFERLVEELAPDRDPGAQPLFRMMFQLVAMPPARMELGDLVLEHLEVERGTATFDLALDLSEEPGGIAIQAIHSTDLFDEATVGRLLAHYAALLAAAVAAPDQPVAGLPFLSPAERRQLLEMGRGADLPAGSDLLHGGFEAQAAVRPDAVAVLCGDDCGDATLTYGDLEGRANGLAHHLLGLGLRPEEPVAVCLERSPGMVAALLGVLKAGGAYLPLDPALPAERLRSLLEDSGAALAVTSGRLAPSLPVETVILEDAAGRPDPPPVEIHGEALAYLLYTSGSTGAPKAVGVPHGAAAAHMRAAAREYGLSDKDRVLQFAAASFDVSLEQILSALGAGATLVMRPEELWSPEELPRRSGELGLTVANLPTTYWHQLAWEAARGEVPGHPLRLVIAGGEAMKAEPLRRWAGGLLAGVRLLNAYGPTETVVTSVVADLTGRGPAPSGLVPVGRALAGRALHVLDALGQPVPLGVPGELCVGGPLLARGYLGRPGLTAERFTPDPFAAEPGSRLYRTGDRVRLLPEGELEFLGRVDQQVKVRGFRVEPGEVEAVLGQHPAVREAVVVAGEDAGGDGRLVAYVTVDPAALAGQEPDGLEAGQVSEWRAVYDENAFGPLPDPTFNALGWTSSYTRGPIPEGEMREWLDGTVERILARRPRRVLEIGCGTGLVLFRVAPGCERYLGTDFSATALEHVRGVLEGQGGLAGVELRRAEAGDPAAWGDERFEAVILNSVVQYFPSLDYLARVLEGAVSRVEAGGFIFVGDVRGLPLLAAFHASVELHRATAALPRERLARRVEAGRAADPELVIDPAWFAALRRRIPRITHVEVQVRRGWADNEMARFRYDAILSVECPAPPEPEWLAAPASVAALRERLARERPDLLAVRGLPNARVQEDLRALELLRAAEGPRTAGELRRAAALVQTAEPAVHPEEIWTLAAGLGYEAGVTWSRDPGDPGRIDVVFRKPGGAEPWPGLAPAEEAGDGGPLASDPLRARAIRLLAPRLRAFVAERLPEPMVPAAVVALEELPLNVHGKVDRRALPEPPEDRPVPGAGFEPPRTPEERALAKIWSELLGLERVGVHDDFFALGGHSLLATQLVSRVRRALGVELELRHLFAEPTVAGLAGRVRAALAETGPLELPPVRPVPRDGRLPLSFGQRRLWFLDRMELGKPGYVMAGAFRLRGDLDVAALAAALGEIVRRHEILRTSFHAEGGEPFQAVGPPRPVPLPVVDLSGLPEPGGEARRLARAEAALPFDLERGLMVRATLVRLGEREQAALVTLHHIASDGWSVGVLVRELGTLYGAAREGSPSPLPGLAVQYGDFAVWQRQNLDGAALGGQLAGWRRRLAGAPAALDLPTDHPRPPVRSARGGRRTFTLTPELANGLRELAIHEGTTLFVVALAAWVALLSRLSHQEDLVVGTPVAGRRQVETEGLIGFFVNTLVLRAGLAGDPGFRELLARAHAAALDAFAGQDVPFERLVEELRPGRSLAHTPLFQVMLSFQHAPAAALELPGLSLEPLLLEPEARFDLELTLAEAPDGGLRGTLDYALDLFEPPTAGRWAGAFAALLEEIAARPGTRLSGLPALSAEERHQILAEWGEGAAAASVPGLTVVDRFEAQAARTPGAPALEAGGEALSYAELHRRAVDLASLLAARGAGPGTVVGLRTERTADLVVGLLGILRAGAAYLPLDPSYPEERLAFQAADSGASLILPGEDGAERASPCRPGSRDLAYLIYTSGTTGRPKAVEVEHGSLAHAIGAFVEAFGFGPGERMPAIAPFSFDIFLFELLAPLLSGGTSVLLPLRPTLDLDLLLGELARSTRFHAVPAVLRQVVDRVLAMGDAERWAGLREVYVGGDAVPTSLLADVGRAFPSARVRVLYGPTEGTIVATSHAVPAGGPARPLLGRPLAGVSVRLLDPAGGTVPAGVAGEIHLGGPGVTRGYRGRPDLTAERYVPAPGGERLYRTGDLARWLPDGRLEFLGRADVQLKVRGFRVEPGEVEARLAAHPGVAQAAVVAQGPAGDRRLAAFYAPAGEAPPAAELRAFLAAALPEHMVPGEIIPLAALPLTPNGKVDRRALAERRSESPDAAAVAPRTPGEEILAGLWADVLGVPVGIYDDFFERGGHSLLATRLVSRVRDVMGVDLPVRALFEEPTVAGLARRIEGASRAASPPVRPEPREGEVPLSFAQQRLWFLDQMEPESPLYNVPAVLRLSGRLDPLALERALGAVVRRHEVLRTVFPATGGRPRQEILPYRPLALPVVDLEGLPPGPAAAEAARLGRVESRRPFCLAKGPLLRAVLLRLPGEEPMEEHALSLVLHHIVSDGWSVGVMVRELAALYTGSSALPELPVQYADFAIWQRRWLAGGELDAQLAWWRQKLAGAPPVLDLPTDRPRPPVRSTAGGELPLDLPPGLRGRLVQLGRREGATLFMALLAAFQALLHRWTGQDDLTVGSPVAGRNRAETEGLIGFFVNTLVMRSTIAGRPSFRRMLAQARETALGAYAHQDVPFERLVEELEPRRDPSRTPLFQALVALVDAPAVPPIPGLALTSSPLETDTAKFDLSLSFVDGGEGLAGTLEYAAGLFDRTTLLRLAGHFRNLLAGASAAPERPLQELPLLAAAEAHQVTVEWAADTTGAYPRDRAVHELFEEVARRAPGLPALTWEGRTLTYAEVNRRANRLAHGLRRRGIGPEVPVAVHLERSADLIVALLAVLKAGGAYVPLDPSYPAERLAFLLEDCGAPVVLTAADLPALADGGSEENPPPAALPENLAYVIYTSGSTGRPKGVEVAHRSIARLVWDPGYLRLGPGDRVAQVSNASFDAATFEIWGALLKGAELVVFPPRPASLEELGERIEREGITALWLTASLYHQMVDGPLHRLAGVRWLLAGGEAVSAAHARKHLAAHPACALIHAYGPTENTTFTTVLPVREVRSPLPVGRPIPNTTVYLLDRDLRPAPIGAAGELYAGGDGLARGYLRRPARTAGAFVPDPFGPPGSRLYRTGDLARWLPDGTVEILGRFDQQVKIRGFRVELGEVEAAALRHPAVRQAAALIREGGPGGRRIVLWAVPAPEAAREGAALRALLKAGLPEFMVPAAIGWLDEMPVTPHGKADRRALAALDIEPERMAARIAPRTPVEERLAAIWAEVLGLQEIGTGDDFFELGGHSLLATQVASRVREELGAELPLKEMFVRPRLGDLAAWIEDERRRGAGLDSTPIAPAPRPAGGLPLSFAQEWLWVVNQLDPQSGAYNAPLPVRLRGDLDAAALERALAEVARRHEVLRTAFVAGAGGPAQLPRPAGPVPFAMADLSALPAERREAEAVRLTLEEARRPFDLAAGRPLRNLLLRLDGGDHRLVINLHHIVTDGWSGGVLLREAAALYEAFRAGAPSPLRELAVQYADFAVWQREWLAGKALDSLLAYWRERLAGPLPVLELPSDLPRAAAGPALGERLPFALGRERTAALTALGRRHGATLFATLLALFETLLLRYSHQEDLLVGTPVANRTRRETEDLIGYFVNNLVLRTDLSGDPPLPVLIGRVQETALGAWSHQDLPLLRLVRELHPERVGAGAMPLFQAWFQLQNTPIPAIALPGLEISAWEIDAPAATFDLELLARETPEGLRGHFVFHPGLFRREMVEGMLRHFLNLVEGALADPGRRLSELPMLAEGERRQLLVPWDPSTERWGEAPLHETFAARVAGSPDAVAVTLEGESLTYGELEGRANGLAHRLRALGVGPERRVGLAMERSLDLVVAILGILKAGGAYVPLDPDYPRERLDFLLADSGVAVIVTTGELLPRLPALAVPVVLPDPGERSEIPPETGVAADHLAYVIYTSGSTGRPKGVMVTHRQAARLFAASGFFGFGPGDVWTLFHSYAFDFSVWEVWGALLFGGRLVVVPRWVSRSPEAFRELLARERVTVLNQTPSAFYPLLQAEGPDLSLRWVIFGGEALEPRKLRPWFERHGDRRPTLVNMFGITETTVHVTLRPLAMADAESGAGVIGAPLPDLRIYLADRHLQPVPAGVAGEILVGGGGVARGYHGRPELTAARFVPDPFSGEPGARLYRSGDLARRRPDGELEYRGRADQQLKVRGFRIEPGEIEAALVRHPAVAEAVVVARELSGGAGGDVRLAAFLAPRPGREVPPAAEVRGFLLGSLPEHMVPASFVALPSLPLTPHGKVDRRALAAAAEAPEPRPEPAAAPLTPLEERLAGLWAGLLEVPEVGRDESFFALGGHSLLMTRVASRVREALGVGLPMKGFFDRPTVAGLAATLVEEMGKKAGEERLEEILALVEGMPESRVLELIAEKRSAVRVLLPGEQPAAVSAAPAFVPARIEIAREPGDDGPLVRLARRGGVALREVVAAMPTADPGEDSLRVTSVAFPTCNRPEVLERGLASYAEAAGGRRFVVMDDSRDPAAREEYRRRLSGLRRRLGVEIVYAGLEEKLRFAADLAGEGVPPDVARIALLDPEGVGLTVGANRNALLLQTIGEGVLSVDDDTLSRVAPSPEREEGVAFLSGTSPGTAFLSGRDPGEIRAFADRAGALASLPLEAADLAGLHEAALGRDLPSWLAGLAGRDPEAPAALDGGDPAFLRALAEGGRVRVTTNGWVGDCGWHSPSFYMLLSGASRRRLLASEEGYRRGTASKEIVRYVPRPTVGNGDSFMATLFTGLDNRGLLPPFPPVLWGEDLLFGIVLQLCFGDARVAHLPGVAAHEPLEFRAFWPGEMTRGASGVDHSRMVSALLDGFRPDRSAAPESELRRLGSYLEGVAGLEPAAFDDLARRSVLARAAAFAQDLEERLESPADGGPAREQWAADVRRYLGLLRRHAAEPGFAVPLDLLYGRSADEARNLARRLLLNYGRLLSHWPDLVAAARRFKARGRGLAEEVR